MAAYEGADEVYVVTITGTLSGAYNAALLAGEEYEQSHEGARVFVLDSLSTGAESRLLVERLAALIKPASPLIPYVRRSGRTMSTPICCLHWSLWQTLHAMAA